MLAYLLNIQISIKISTIYLNKYLWNTTTATVLCIIRVKPTRHPIYLPMQSAKSLNHKDHCGRLFKSRLKRETNLTCIAFK